MTGDVTLTEAERMSEYTPSTGDVRMVWIDAQDITHGEGQDFHGAEFDRWLEALKAEVAAKALRDFADRYEATHQGAKDEGDRLHAASAAYWQGSDDAVGHFIGSLRSRADFEIHGHDEREAKGHDE